MLYALLRIAAITFGLVALAVIAGISYGAGNLRADAARVPGAATATTPTPETTSGTTSETTPVTTPVTTPMAATTPAAEAPATAEATPVEAPPAAEATAAATAAPDAGDPLRPRGWTDASHGNRVAPNYDVVLPVDAVNTITITIAPADWAAMQEDLDKIYAPSLDLRQAMLAAGPDLTPAERDALMQQLLADRIAARAAAASSLTVTAPITVTDAVTMAAPLTGTAQVTATDPITVEADGESNDSSRSPMWVPATIRFGDQEWPHVGVRYKGASSLLQPWTRGEMKLPLKLDFDQFEDDYPEIDNQRFFGFKELSLANNHRDPAGMRDILVYELLAAAGLPSLRAAPYEIVLDYGEGPLRLGLYTAVEVVDETGVPSTFGSDDGNIYEAEGPGSSLAADLAADLEESFQKKNNEEREDWGDIWTLYDVLHDPKRTSDPEAWRADLAASFDVDGFLAWLGLAAVVGHVDTYGFAPHNFYLYHDPATDRLTWFSWDHNQTFQPELRPHPRLDKANATANWPLIRYLLDDPVYWDRYVELLAENYAGPLAPDAVLARIRAHAAVIKPFATRDMTPEEYAAAVQVLVDYVDLRAGDVEEFLAGQE
jgi:hypothetical protein